MLGGVRACQDQFTRKLDSALVFATHRRAFSISNRNLVMVHAMHYPMLPFPCQRV